MTTQAGASASLRASESGRVCDPFRQWRLAQSGPSRNMPILPSQTVRQDSLAVSDSYAAGATRARPRPIWPPFMDEVSVS
jgi:hypothetical protein